MEGLPVDVVLVGMELVGAVLVGTELVVAELVGAELPVALRPEVVPPVDPDAILVPAVLPVVLPCDPRVDGLPVETDVVPVGTELVGAELVGTELVGTEPVGAELLVAPTPEVMPPVEDDAPLVPAVLPCEPRTVGLPVEAGAVLVGLGLFGATAVPLVGDAMEVLPEPP